MTQKQWYYEYDMAATTYTYGRLGGPDGSAVQGNGGIKTTGASTTVDAVGGGSYGNDSPFAPCNVGDVIIFRKLDSAPLIRKIATKPSNIQITIDSAVDLGTGIAAWDFLPFRNGAGFTFGWHHTQAFRVVTVYIDPRTIAAAGGVDYSIEGYVGHLTQDVITIATANIAASLPAGIKVQITDKFNGIRVGLKGGSGFAGTDVVSVHMVGQQY